MREPTPVASTAVAAAFAVFGWRYLADVLVAAAVSFVAGIIVYAKRTEV